MKALSILRRRDRGNPQNPTGHSPLAFQNRIIADVVGPDGTVKQHIDHRGNILCQLGINHAMEWLSTSTTAGSAFAQTLAIGTHTAAENSTHTGLLASTQLCGTFTRSDAGSYTARFNGTFASDGNASEIHEVGLMYSNVGNDSLIARSMLGTDSINRGASDEIQVTYDLIGSTV